MIKKLVKDFVVDVVADFSVIVLGGGMLFPPCSILFYLTDLDYSAIKVAFILSTIAVIFSRFKKIKGVE